MLFVFCAKMLGRYVCENMLKKNMDDFGCDRSIHVGHEHYFHIYISMPTVVEWRHPKPWILRTMKLPDRRKYTIKSAVNLFFFCLCECEEQCVSNTLAAYEQGSVYYHHHYYYYVGM